LDTDPPALRIEDLVAGYGEADVLRGITLNIPAGRITTIIGPNGAGKSTLLKTIFGMVKTRRGSIVHADHELVGLSSDEILRLGVALVPQGRCNFPMMTVHENLEMGAFTRSDPAVKRDIQALYERFPMLAQKRTALAGYLSGGQQQILEMAMALVQRPRLLLLDEPSLGLSPQMLGEVFERVRDINQSGVTVMMVEQNARQALALSDWGVVLELGRERLEGPGHTLLDEPEIRRLYLGG
jgi:ABC-type branched-subunit amino acid transport system ATPase component